MIFKMHLLLQALKCNYVQCLQIFSSFLLLIAEHDLQGQSRDRSEAFGTCSHSVLTSTLHSSLNGLLGVPLKMHGPFARVLPSVYTVSLPPHPFFCYSYSTLHLPAEMLFAEQLSLTIPTPKSDRFHD